MTNNNSKLDGTLSKCKHENCRFAAKENSYLCLDCKGYETDCKFCNSKKTGEEKRKDEVMRIIQLVTEKAELVGKRQTLSRLEDAVEKKIQSIQQNSYSDYRRAWDEILEKIKEMKK